MTKFIRRSLSRAYMQACMQIEVDENNEPIYVTFVSYRSPIIAIDLVEHTLYFYPTKVNYSRSTTKQTSCFARDILPDNMQYYYLKQASVEKEIDEMYVLDREVNYIRDQLEYFIEHGKNIKY